MAELPLRERKHAATKASLMRGIIARLGRQSLDEIAVKDVCAEAQVSEATFFNYFPTKAAAIGYRVQLWSIEAQWVMARRLAAGGTQLEAVRALFDTAAGDEGATPGIMREVLIYQARHQLEFVPLTRAEYALHFPDRAGIEMIRAEGVNQLLNTALTAARRAGELPAQLDLQALTVTLMGVFFLTPILLESAGPGGLGDAYRRQLDLLLAPSLPPPRRSPKR